MTEVLATRPVSTMARRDELTIEDLIEQVEKIQQVMRRVMKEGEHYGVIPGTNSKPSLLKPGAEKLLTMFRLAPDPHSVETRDGKHLTVKTKMVLTHIPTGEVWGAGEGSCSTKESRYAYRKGKRVCPKCGADAINKSKFPPRGKPNDEPGFYCYAKVGGCGVEFAADDASIIGQEIGRVANEDLADQENTVLKMANKRALVAAVLNVTAASDIFTQDLEDLVDRTPAAPARTVVVDAEPSAEESAALFPDDEPAPVAGGEDRPFLIKGCERKSVEHNITTEEALALGIEFTEGRSLQKATDAQLRALYRLLSNTVAVGAWRKEQEKKAKKA